MADALRQAIASGRYAPGETLPTIREWAQMLGVSPRVPKAVIPRLVKEGLVVARPRHGCIVAPRGTFAFSGHVLAVMPAEAHFLNSAILCASMAKRLEDAGYLVSVARVHQSKEGRSEYPGLRLALRQSVDLAVFLLRDPAAARCAKRLGVPFVTMGDGRLAGCVGHVERDYAEAMWEMANDFKMHGVRSVGLVFKRDRGEEGYAEAMRRQGLKVELMPVGVDPQLPPERRIEAILAGARDAFERRLSRSRILPDVLHFEDDHLLMGAVPVLLAHGVRIPKDVRLSSLSNYGRGPVLPFPLARIEVNQYTNGNMLADAVLSYFEKGTFPRGMTFAAKYLSDRLK